MNRKPYNQLWLPFVETKSDLFDTQPDADHPMQDVQLMEAVLERGNMFRALAQVERNGGRPGVDGMTVNELRDYLRRDWLSVRQLLLEGRYRPQPVRRVSIPKPTGGMRQLGIPTVLDRLIQQALLQILQPQWDATFSESSYGFRPQRNAHQAVAQAQRHIRVGFTWVVDIDLEKFFDRVNHDKLMQLVTQRLKDRRLLSLIRRYLQAGALVDDAYHASVEGTPQGGPLSPLLANLLLDGLDRELESRGHRFVRYADDCNVYVRSRRAGQRVLQSLTRFLSQRLKLHVNDRKSAVDRPWKRKFLGFSFTRRDFRRKVSLSAIKRLKDRVRDVTKRTRGRSIYHIVQELRRLLRGWWGYYRFTEATYIFKEVDSWIRRRLRCYLWKQWGRRQHRELRKRGVRGELVWNTAKSAHGPWRLSRSPALMYALPWHYFAKLGLPSLYERTLWQPNRRGT
jgi:RNA-directed DNA polymerase